MDLTLNKNLSINYKNESQKIRVLSEFWVESKIFCPNCGNIKINNYENNKPLADFYCKKCFEDFELKAKKGKFNKKISAGAYSKNNRKN